MPNESGRLTEAEFEGIRGRARLREGTLPDLLIPREHVTQVQELIQQVDQDIPALLRHVDYLEELVRAQRDQLQYAGRDRAANADTGFMRQQLNEARAEATEWRRNWNQAQREIERVIGTRSQTWILKLWSKL
jgi:chromosome segregation ATPase